MKWRINFALLKHAFQKTNDANIFELLYHFREDTWGNGYAFEAAKSVLEYG
ncbi:GNAT family N-acetyltransferase [Bacillus sp. EAC]|uniref:GNAT family N-acetyltransferase n=1 Tax=Bacillus sp. EAC TaxID=1978338 RepID=UPI00358EE2FE